MLFVVKYIPPRTLYLEILSKFWIKLNFNIQTSTLNMNSEWLDSPVDSRDWLYHFLIVGASNLAVVTGVDLFRYRFIFDTWSRVREFIFDFITLTRRRNALLSEFLLFSLRHWNKTRHRICNMIYDLYHISYMICGIWYASHHISINYGV